MRKRKLNNATIKFLEKSFPEENKIKSNESNRKKRSNTKDRRRD